MLHAIISWKNYLIFLGVFYALSEVNDFVGQYLSDTGVTEAVGQTAAFGLSLTCVYVALIVSVYILNLIKSKFNI